MSAPQFTPGPWHITTTPNPHVAGASWREIRAGENGQVLAEVYHDVGKPWPTVFDDDAEANSRLIAAAPELYQALDEAICLVPANQRAALAKFNAALAKARGDQ